MTSFEPGGFAEFVRLPPINVAHGTFHLPDSVTFEEGTFVEPLACVVRGQRLAGVGPGDSVAVLGSGISGVLMIQQARANGASRIVATDVSDERLALATRFGADAVVRADSPEFDDEIRAANGGNAVDRVVLCTGAKPAMAQAFREGHLGIMDYYRMRNIQSDTGMRDSIAGGGKTSGGHKAE